MKNAGKSRGGHTPQRRVSWDFQKLESTLDGVRVRVEVDGKQSPSQIQSRVRLGVVEVVLRRTSIQGGTNFDAGGSVERILTFLGSEHSRGRRFGKTKNSWSVRYKTRNCQENGLGEQEKRTKKDRKLVCRLFYYAVAVAVPPKLFDSLFVVISFFVVRKRSLKKGSRTKLLNEIVYIYLLETNAEISDIPGHVASLEPALNLNKPVKGTFERTVLLIFFPH
ncbi:hypothetical protein BCR39DRAFT_21156 [Naematelia encephala]|uniref:Uncharacterized protein n=1 Tax=Naematelia encephala TaxID=71784 RepID=A0A1Y2BN29_9TREE|nr:hypothetical protein BCR39DRAFT_21156 [Naematelia encephala]